MDTKFFQLMFEKHEAIMLLIDPNTGQIRQSNQAASRFYGYTAAQLNGMKVYDISILPFEEMAIRRQAALEGEHNTFITPHRLASGEIRTVEVDISPITWENSTFLFAIIHDITQRKQAEESLQQSEQKFRSIVESVLEGIIMVDSTGCITLVNAPAAQMFDYAAEELLGQPLDMLLPKHYREAHASHLSHYFTHPQIRPMAHGLELVGRRKNGQEFPVEIGLSHAELDGQMVAISFIQDITERKQAEEALRESERKLHTLFELLPIGISVLDTANQIVYMNQALEEILQISSTGLARGDYRQRTYLQADGTPMSATDFASSQAIQKQQPIYNVETGVVIENDEIVWTSVSAIPVAYADWCVIIVTADITKRKRLEEMLKAKQEQQHLQMMRRVLTKQKQEQARRAREEEHLLHELFEAIPVPIFYKDPQGKYLACNQAFATLAELPKTEIIGKTAFEITPEAYARNYHAADLALIAQPQVKTYEYKAYHPALQQELTFLMTKSVIKNVDDEVTGIVGVITDITRQKRLEAILQERLEFFQLLLEKHNAIMLLIDPISGQIIESNQAARAFYGYSVTEMNGLKIQDINILPPAEIAQERQLALHEERNYFIFPHRLASGEIRTVEVHSSPIIWKNGHVLFSIIHDITERQRLETALRESEAKFRSYIDNSPDGVFVANDQGNFLEVNQAAALITGYPEAELLQMNIASLLPSDMLEAGLNHFKTVQSTGYATSEFMFLHQSGQKRWWSVDAVKLSATRYLGFVKDITERKKAEEALHESEERWQYALEGSGDGVWDWNAETNQVYFSPRWKEIIGYAEHEISSDLSEWDKRIHPDDKAAIYEKLNAHLRGETPYYQSEHRLLHRDGSYRWILDRGKVMSWLEAGKPLRIVGTHTDITERKLIQQALQASETRYRALEGELRELNIQKDRFLAIIAHDLRNPFSAILGFSDYLNETWQTIEKADLKIAVKAIQSSAHNLYKLLENLLAWSQVQQDALAFEPMELNIAEMGQEPLALLALNATSKEIMLHNLAHSEHLVYGDYNMINTIMRNLLSNALKFTPRGGQITLFTEAMADFIKISITDTGVGIAPENQAKLFHMESKYKTPGTENEPGTGLGLLLCQQLVHKNGGEIGVTSVEGQGSTFYFTLPKFSFNPS